MQIVTSKPTITRRELEGVLDCLINDELTTGNTVKTMESHISQQTGQKYPLATSSLTAAYHLIFRALQVQEDDEIILPSYIDQAPLSALHITGGTPVLVDCDENSLFTGPEAVKKRITEKTKAVVISHLFGFHYPVEELANISVPLIEDISHALGTEYEEQPVGQWGTFSVASFDTSSMITTGNGGIVLTGNSKYFSIMRDLRGGRDNVINYDYLMTDLQGAMGVSQLMRLGKFLERRREIANIYYDALRITNHRLPVPFNDEYGYQSFPVIFDSPVDKINKYWKKSGIEIVNPVATPLHALLGYDKKNYPVSERWSRKLFTVPIYPTLTKKNVEKIAKLLSGFI